MIIINRLTTGLEAKLQEFSKINADYAPLYEAWTINKRSLETLMQITVGIFPHYSLHDASHCRSILNNIEMLLGDNRINELSPTDIWLLLNSIYAHDIGMVSIKSLTKEWEREEFRKFVENCAQGHSGDELAEHAALVTSIDEKGAFGEWSLSIHLSVLFLLAEYYRKNHAERSSSAITNHLNIDLSVNGLIPQRFVEWIAKIVQSHGEDFSFILSLSYEDNGFCRDYIHPRFLASLLCLGDALDMDNSRFHPHSEMLIDSFPASSKTHKNKHEAIRQLRITPECIEIAADCGKASDYHATYRLLREWCDMLNGLTCNIALNWHDLIPDNLSGSAPTLKDVVYYVGNKVIDATLAKLKFEISQERAFELIQGANIYKSNLDYIRELLQNAMDATKIQFWKDVKARVFSENEVDYSCLDSFQPYHIKNMNILERYAITISFEALDGDVYRVIVKDSGTGFSRASLYEMSRAGKSYSTGKRKELISAMPKWLMPTGNFGIGLQSVFLVCDSFRCKTRSRDSGISYDIIFHARSSGGYLDVIEKPCENDYGAEFIVDCKNDRLFSPDNYYDTLNTDSHKIYNKYNIFTNSTPENVGAQMGVINSFSHAIGQVNESFVPVKYLFNGNCYEPPKVEDEYNVYNLIARCGNEGELTDGKYKVIFDPQSLYCGIWDCVDYNYISLSPHDRHNTVFYKDILVKESRAPDKYGLMAKCYFFGSSAADMLELSRSKLTQKGEALVSEYTDIALELWRGKFYERFDEVASALREHAKNQELAHVYSNWWFICLLTVYFSEHENRADMLNALIELELDHIINAYVYNDANNAYGFQQISSKSFFKGIISEQAYVFCTYDLPSYGHYKEENEKHLNRMAPEISKYRHIFDKSIFLGHLLRWYGKEVFGEKYYALTLCVSKTIQPSVTLDYKSFINMSFNRAIGEKNDEHILLTQCVDRYEALSLSYDKIKSQPLEFFLSVNRLYFPFNGAYMLIPLNAAQIIDVKQGKYGKEQLVAEATGAEQYAAVVDFTVGNQFTQNKYDKNTVDAEYRKLIYDIYETLAGSE